MNCTMLEKGCAHLEIGFNFSVVGGEPDAAWREGLEAQMEHRNELVHHFLGRFDLELRMVAVWPASI